MQAVGAAAALVVYRFGARAHVAACRRPEVALLRAPVDLKELERRCLGLTGVLRDRAPLAAAEPGSGAARRYSREDLARIASMPTDITCECPRHLAELILGLNAFEEYSAGCEQHDERDAALHRKLQETAIASRALLEQALSRVVDREALSPGTDS